MRPRESFLVRVHRDDPDALVENVSTQERVRVALHDVGAQIERWLHGEPDSGVPPRSEPDVKGRS